MFSMIPMTGRPSFSTNFADFLASRVATSCGVVTITAPRTLGAELGNRERFVPGSGRQVDDKVVERPPVDLGEELLDRCHLHRTAPDDRRIESGMRKAIEITEASR